MFQPPAEMGKKGLLKTCTFEKQEQREEWLKLSRVYGGKETPHDQQLYLT